MVRESLPPSAGIGNREGAARNPVPGLDGAHPPSGSGDAEAILDSSHPLLGGIERAQPPHCAGRCDSRGCQCHAYAGPYHGQCRVLRTGRTWVDPAWKKTIVGMATEEIAKLQKAIGTNSEVIIDSGNVPQLLNRAAEQTKADV